MTLNHDAPFNMTNARKLALSVLTRQPLVIPGRRPKGDVAQSILDLFADAGLVERTDALITVTVVPPVVTFGWALTDAGRKFSNKVWPGNTNCWWKDTTLVEFYEEQTGRRLEMTS